VGFASYLEDITDRFDEGGGSAFDHWPTYLGTAPRRRDIEEARLALGDPLDRPRRLIRDFWRYYRAEQQLARPAGNWERHQQNIEALHSMLAPVAGLRADASGAWEAVSSVEQRLRSFFRDTPVYGPLSPTVLDQVGRASREIQSRAARVERQLKEFAAAAKKLPLDLPGLPGVLEDARRLAEIRKQLDADLASRRRYDDLTREVRAWGDQFLGLYTRLAVQARYRPALQHLHRLRLNREQERFVALKHDGVYRIQGASGSGKTIILVHRAIRLAVENPTSAVRVFTINRSLAGLLRESIAAVHGSVPPNLHVSAFYDLLGGVLAALGHGAERFRLVDDRSGERIATSWRDFYQHRGRTAEANVFADPTVGGLLDTLGRRERHPVDPCQYLRDEVVYVQSAYLPADREQYLTEPRSGRGINLLEGPRRACLRVLAAWEEWLDKGDLCDVDGLTVRVADLLRDPGAVERVRAAFPTGHVLADEVQDFSTLELGLLRRLATDPDGPNRFFLVGDLNQKVFPKQHRATRAGFNLRGRSETLARNYRNTRQILAAAYQLPRAYPPQADEQLEVAAPELSEYEGGRPVILGCAAGDHAARVLEVLRLRRGKRVAVVSENDALLAAVREGAGRLGLRCHDLYRVEDLDLWRDQRVASLAADVVVSRLEAVKGFEFDTVIACDLSDGAVPRPGTPPEEYWRAAAVVYAALTRARDELVMTYVGEPSVFLTAMGDTVERHDGSIGEGLGRILGGG
jgi:superfamily I DNA/RNA helicase